MWNIKWKLQNCLVNKHYVTLQIIQVESLDFNNFKYEIRAFLYQNKKKKWKRQKIENLQWINIWTLSPFSTSVEILFNCMVSSAADLYRQFLRGKSVCVRTRAERTKQEDKWNLGAVVSRCGFRKIRNRPG